MTERKLYEAPATWMQSAVDALAAAGVQVVAPVNGQGDIVRLETVAPDQELARDYLNVLVPLKQYFLPPSEVLLEYENAADGDVQVKPRTVSPEEMVVMGARPCDAAAIAVLDKVFKWDYDDLSYSARRTRTTVVAFACTEPDDKCFCTSLGGSPHGTSGADVLVFRDGDGSALMQVNTEKGERLIERLGNLVKPAEDAEPPAPPELKQGVDAETIKGWLDDNFESEFWIQTSLRCLGCAACSYLCPTCHCFDIVDESLWNRGERRRNWDCCSFGEFTAHASGHNPRPNRAARYRQRIMHKFKYFPDKFGMVACVGCGRCVRGCGAGQGLLTVLTDIEAR